MNIFHIWLGDECKGNLLAEDASQAERLARKRWGDHAEVKQVLYRETPQEVEINPIEYTA